MFLVEPSFRALVLRGIPRLSFDRLRLFLLSAPRAYLSQKPSEMRTDSENVKAYLYFHKVKVQELPPGMQVVLKEIRDHNKYPELHRADHKHHWQNKENHEQNQESRKGYEEFREGKMSRCSARAESRATYIMVSICYCLCFLYGRAADN